MGEKEGRKKERARERERLSLGLTTADGTNHHKEKKNSWVKKIKKIIKYNKRD